MAIRQSPGPPLPEGVPRPEPRRRPHRPLLRRPLLNSGRATDGVASGAPRDDADRISRPPAGAGRFLEDRPIPEKTSPAKMALALEAIDWGTADDWMRMQATYELAQARRQREHVYGAPDGAARRE